MGVNDEVEADRTAGGECVLSIVGHWGKRMHIRTAQQELQFVHKENQP